ncbi:hypothetical protein PF005_g17875 [Phytophthora fragariae]|uniref:Uncharacterized protein n=1 Tax=Phytophthora fragariae TaxID=53985 RepID=A0A6A4CKK2_9STRA|nr:hypothetical protein PF003_g17045 [Phytophthora fragariae]KAE8929805.1 hypothetical protein PF009_g20100 [Phytophthora fragariae]KAE8988814.1 hypothetical protein PF011_g19021 [Phytophthora fragariae]KAE9087592.1 hypothetical protein PF007_g20319 [Phytophthora fragariae]KAE9087794.1 hypothetical protein PF010_g19604 [Phytophthora fragariae]
MGFHASRSLCVAAYMYQIASAHETAYTIDATTADESAVNGSTWTGELKLYKDANFRSLLLTLTFNTANLCFNLACGDIDDEISSASWKGLPVKAFFPGGTTSLLVFYRDIDCTGDSQGWPTSYEKAPNFGAVEMNDAASSFMFVELAFGVENGVHEICDYKMTSND